MDTQNLFKQCYLVFFLAGTFTGISFSSEEEAAAREQLFAAIDAEDTVEVRRLLNTHPVLLNVRGSATGNLTPLHAAVMVKNLNIVRLFLAAGALTNERDGIGDTPLHVAINRGSEDIVRLLLAYGADFTCRDCVGRSPLRCALSEENLAISEALMQQGADPDDGAGWSCAPNLILAICCNNCAAVQLLARCGALIDIKDDLNGWTPLLFALRSASRGAIARLLLEFGVPLEVDEEVRLLRIRSTEEFPFREIIQNRKNAVTTALFDEELPFFSHLSPDVIRDIIDYTVTPILPA